jgi:hypothetical protein
MADIGPNSRHRPVVRRITGYIGFDASPRFFDLRGALVEAISEGLPRSEWQIDDEEVFVWAEDELWLFNVDERSLFMSFDERVRIPLLRPPASRAITEVLVRLGADAAFLGASISTVTEANSLDGLHAWLQDRIGPARASLFDAFGGPPTDTTWQFEIADDQEIYNLSLGALTAEEAIESDEIRISGEDTTLPDVFLLAEVRNRSTQNPPLPVAETVDAWISKLIAAGKASATFHRALSADNDD